MKYETATLHIFFIVHTQIPISFAYFSRSIRQNFDGDMCELFLDICFIQIPSKI